MVIEICAKYLGVDLYSKSLISDIWLPIFGIFDSESAPTKIKTLRESKNKKQTKKKKKL